MWKAIIILSVLALTACMSSEELQREQQRRDQQFVADIDAIGEKGQIDYFACRFVRHVWECRQEVWEKTTKPHLPLGKQQEFLQHYIDVAEKRGAAHVLKANQQPCGEVKSLDNFFWREGQEAICSNGMTYQIERDKGIWRVLQLKGGA